MQTTGQRRRRALGQAQPPRPLGPSKILLLNKPFNVMCQFTDNQGRATLADFVAEPGIYPAGRLDYDSEGLLLLTNDGRLQAQLALHPLRRDVAAEAGDEHVADPSPNVHVTVRVDLAEIAKYIDWTPFFQAWELAGRFPAILTDEVVGTQASELYRDARAMLDRIVSEKWLTAKAVFGLWPANSVGDDVELTVDGRSERLHFLRQQVDKPVERPDFCLADFIAPKDSGRQDWIGMFAVTAGIGIDTHVARFEADHDDYNAILLKALADRLAEALAERLHQRVRKEFWGFAADEDLDNEALIAEQYRGIRPAPGYPACPDHTVKK